MRQPLRDCIQKRIPLLFDGAFGTLLYKQGVYINRCFEEANLSNPSLVKELLGAYAEAGCNILSTNSWGANRVKLRNHNLHDKISAINTKAANLAREIAGENMYVAGSIGPLGVQLEPWGPTSFQQAQDIFHEQASALIEGGADAISLETFSDIAEIKQAISAVRSIREDIPIFAQVVINLEGNLIIGTPVEWAIQQLDEWGADVVGLNCSVGPGPMVTALKKIKQVTKKPIIVQPNSGFPKEVDGRKIYMCTPEYLAEFTKTFFQEGVQFVGGCCGTTPEHIKAMAQAFRHYRAMSQLEEDTPTTSNVKVVTPSLPEADRVPPEQKSSWSKKIAKGESVISVELLPPASVMPDKIIAQSQELKLKGVDAINIPDGPRASARMSAIMTAVMIEQRAEIETVLHYTCRDRNLLGMQSDMLGAHAIGLRNMLLVTGDPPKLGNYPNATGVFDVDAIGLTNMVHRLNGGIDLGGRSIGQPTSMSIGVGVNPVHRNFEYEMKRFYYKVDAGAEWAITQPVFDMEAILRFLDYIHKHNLAIPIIAGIWPLVSFRNAQFMNNEVPGVVIPEPVMARMAEQKSPEDAKKVGVAIAAEMAEKLTKEVAGIQVSAPFGRIDLALQVAGR